MLVCIHRIRWGTLATLILHLIVSDSLPVRNLLSMSDRGR